MTDDLISRADAIEAIEWGKTYVSIFDESGNIFHPFETANKELSEAITRIKAIPSAQPKRGEWIAVTKDDLSHWECSLCGKPALLDNNEQMCLSNFCPNCGARMKGADDE